MGLFSILKKKQHKQIGPNDDPSELFAEELKSPPGPDWVFEISTDGRGRVLESGWKPPIKPSRLDRVDLSALRPYVERLLSSNNWFTSVTIVSLEGDHAASLWRMNGVVSTSVHIQAEERWLEERARAHIAQTGAQPICDYLLADGATRILQWPLTGGTDTITQSFLNVATEMCGIVSQEPVDVTYEEHVDERGKHRSPVTTIITIQPASQDVEANL